MYTYKIIFNNVSFFYLDFFKSANTHGNKLHTYVPSNSIVRLMENWGDEMIKRVQWVITNASELAEKPDIIIRLT